MRGVAGATVVAALVALGSSPLVAAEDRVLNIYNRSEYIAPETVEKFSAETGIKINYDVYESNEALEAKLLAGNAIYDLVVSSDSLFLARQIKAKTYRKIDKAKLKNYDNLDNEILAGSAIADPGNAYGVPYLW